jgi:hypothetical protein
MNKNETGLGYYRDSIRTSGEVVSLFVRDKVVICKLVLFIAAKYTYFLTIQFILSFLTKYQHC